jgi:hypothetical protein
VIRSARHEAPRELTTRARRGPGALAPPRVGHQRVPLAIPGAVADLWTDADWWSMDLIPGERALTLHPWAWLEAARELPAAVRPVMDRTGARRLVIEAPAQRGPGLDAWVACAAASLVAAHAVLTEAGASGGPPARERVVGALPAELGADLDWPATERDDGTRGFDLGASDTPHQAIAGLTPAGELVVEAPAGRWPTGSAVARDALARAFLLAAGATRLARPFGVATDAGTAAGFEVHLPAPVTAAALGHALHALAAAMESCAAEAPLLVQDEVARAFVARWSDAAIAASREHP